MDYIKKHYDGVILVVVGILAIAIAAWIINSVTGFSGKFEGRNSSKPRNNELPPAEVEPLQQRMASLAATPRWDAHDGSLFVSRVYILKDGELVDPIEGDRPLHPPVPNDWLLKYDLDYTQSDILQSDPDSDGFSVLEEWKADTDPTNTASVPPIWTKLRLDNFNKVSFTLLFAGSPDGGSTFTINFPDDRSQPTRFLELGDTIEVAGSTYELVKYTPKTTTINDIIRDVSELVLQDKATGNTITMVAGKVHDSPTISANFLNLIDAKSTEMLQVGDTFALDQAPGEIYRVEEIAPDKAVLIKTNTGERLEISPK